MTATREQAAQALLAQLQTIAVFKLVQRRLLDPALITPALSPALVLVESGEDYQNATPQNPPRRTLKFAAAIFNNVGGDDPSAVPATVVNAALDALDALMNSLSNPLTKRVTLGDLVYHARIDGEIVKAPGETTGLAMAVVPFEVVLP